jgi:hypothetical protein
MDYVGTPIRAGSSHQEAVRAIQERLNALRITVIGGGAPVVVDGIFGPSTENGVRLFQAQSTDARGRALEVDGVVGPATWAALFGTGELIADRSDSELIRRMIEIASSQVGVREDPIGSNRGEQVDAYLRRCGLDPEEASYAWCVAFVYWCFDEAANQLGHDNDMPKTAGVHDLWNRLGEAGRTRLTPGQAQRNPELIKPGMMFFIDTGGGFGHAGIIKAVEGAVLRTIEGNTTDREGSREGIGVFERAIRRIAQINLGFASLI